ncbi:MAG: thioredoxin-dependent thiol peroxidase [bacterium]|nr:thioredoxin-dependent thiol peroxidase [bacterium]
MKKGLRAPSFEGIDQHGATIRLSDFRGKKLVLYFYPKDNTPGCTATACNLRDEYLVLQSNNYAVIGVSADDQKSHAKFANKYHLPFSLIADTERTIIRAYDVWGQKQLAGRIYDGIVRTTFVINEKGILENVITKVDTARHADQIRGE